MPDIILEGVTATVIGMGMVFGVLSILCIILSFFKYLTPPVQPKKDTEEEMDEFEEILEEADFEEAYDTTGNADDSSELIAVISAAVSACMGEGARIASITPVTQEAPHNASRSPYRGWTAAAIKESHRGLY